MRVISWCGPAPWAAAWMTTGGWASERARSAEVTTMATPPSDSWQPSSRCSGSTNPPDARWPSGGRGRWGTRGWGWGARVSPRAPRDPAEVLAGRAVLVGVTLGLHGDPGGRGG